MRGTQLSRKPKFVLLLASCKIKKTVPGTVEKYDRLHTEYSGFCPVALLSGGSFHYYYILSTTHHPTTLQEGSYCLATPSWAPCAGKGSCTCVPQLTELSSLVVILTSSYRGSGVSCTGTLSWTSFSLIRRNMSWSRRRTSESRGKFC